MALKHRNPWDEDETEDTSPMPFDVVIGYILNGLASIGAFSLFVAICIYAGYLSA